MRKNQVIAPGAMVIVWLSEAEQKRREMIISALREHKHVGKAADSLGIGQRRLYRWMRKYNLTLKGVLGWPSMPRSPEPDSTQEVAKPAKSEVAPPEGNDKPKQHVADPAHFGIAA